MGAFTIKRKTIAKRLRPKLLDIKHPFFYFVSGGADYFSAASQPHKCGRGR